MRRQREDVIEISDDEEEEDDDDDTDAQKENDMRALTPPHPRQVKTQRQPPSQKKVQSNPIAVATQPQPAAKRATLSAPTKSNTESSSAPESIVSAAFLNKLDNCKKRVQLTLTDHERAQRRSAPLFYEQRLKSACAGLKAQTICSVDLSTLVVTDRGSVFFAWIARCGPTTTSDEFKRKIAVVAKFVKVLLEPDAPTPTAPSSSSSCDDTGNASVGWGKRAAHEFMYATIAPCQILEDDGETGGASSLLKCLQEAKRSGDFVAEGVVLGCSRFFGGTLLGQDRFRHIETVGKAVLREFMRID